MRIFTIVAVAGLAGCAALPPAAIPVSIPVAVEHVSHLTQHAPFTSHPTNYGWNMAEIGLRWNVDGVKITLMEGYCLGPELDHKREVFLGRFEYEFRLR